MVPVAATPAIRVIPPEAGISIRKRAGGAAVPVLREIPVIAGMTAVPFLDEIPAFAGMTGGREGTVTRRRCRRELGRPGGASDCPWSNALT